MPSDKQNAEFMYAMLKQLDLKYIDWNRVAAANAITNGHAARMRFSRYRHAMENASADGDADGGEKARCKGAARTKKRRRRGGKGEAGARTSEGEDDEEGGAGWGVKKGEGSVDGEEEEEEEEERRPRRRVKVEGGLKAESGVDEDDVPIRLRVKREGRTEVKAEGGEREGREGSVVMEGIPVVKLEEDD